MSNKKRRSGWIGINPEKYGLDRSSLPEPSLYYSMHIKNLRRRQGKQWAMGLCPFHADNNPSFGVNLVSGGFVCHGCGVRGGDVVKFHMLSQNLDFRAACRDLGAWRDR